MEKKKIFEEAEVLLLLELHNGCCKCGLRIVQKTQFEKTGINLLTN